jgi:hypothetical protein
VDLGYDSDVASITSISAIIGQQDDEILSEALAWLAIPNSYPTWSQVLYGCLGGKTPTMGKYITVLTVLAAQGSLPPGTKHPVLRGHKDAHAIRISVNIFTVRTREQNTAGIYYNPFRPMDPAYLVA